AIDTATHTVDWRAPLGASAVADLALADGTVFVAGGGPDLSQRTVQAFPAAGCGLPTCSATWRTAPGTAGEVVAPTVAGGVLYVGAGSDVRAYDAGGCGATTCDPIATVSLDDNAPVTQVVVAEGRLHVASPARLTVFAPAP